MGYGPPAPCRRRDRALDRGGRRAARIPARRGGAAARPADQQSSAACSPSSRCSWCRWRSSSIAIVTQSRTRPVSHGQGELPRERAGGRQPLTWRMVLIAVAVVDRVAASGRAAVADERTTGYRRATARRRHPAVGCSCAARRAARGAGAVVQCVLVAGRFDRAADDAGIRRRGDRRPQAATSRSAAPPRPATNIQLRQRLLRPTR